MQTWMCKHDLGLVEVGRLSCLKVIFEGIWLIFLFGNDFPKIVIGFLISIL